MANEFDIKVVNPKNIVEPNLPAHVRKLKIRLIEDVSQADFILAAEVEQLCEAIDGIPHHAVANSLVEGHNYPERFVEVEAPLRETLESLSGEYYIDDKKILSYRKVDAGQVAGLLDLPLEARNMQLVFRSQQVSLPEGEEGIIDFIAIKKEERPLMGEVVETTQAVQKSMEPTQNYSVVDEATQIAQEEWSKSLLSTIKK